MKLSLRLERYGHAGWAFSITSERGMTRYRTNPAGDGLWEYLSVPGQTYEDGSSVMEYRQIHGTAQFSLPKERKPAYDKIRHDWCATEPAP